MRFVDRSHREGPLGSVFNDDGDDLGGVRGHLGSGNLLDQFPLLPEVLGLSKPEETHYMPGDPEFLFCAFSPPRRDGSNELQAGTQGQETAGKRPKTRDLGPSFDVPGAVGRITWG